MNLILMSDKDSGQPVTRQSSIGGGGGLMLTSRPQYRPEFETWNVRGKYNLIKNLGSGAYGKVAEARNNKTNERVAIKFMEKIFQDSYTDARRAFREIHILRNLGSHPNIVALKEVFAPRYDSSTHGASNIAGSQLPVKIQDFIDLYAVFEYMDTDLHKIFKSGQALGVDHIKWIAYQMVNGLKYIHSARVIHRDLKPANILINCDDCTTKIADFGLSRVVDESMVVHPQTSVFGFQETAALKRTLTQHVITRWYRAPEVILKQRYTSAVDIWSLGCILAEMFACQSENQGLSSKRPLFPGEKCGELSLDDDVIEDFDAAFNDEASQLMVIFKIIGTPKRDDISMYDIKTKLNLVNMKTMKPRDFALLYPNTPPQGLDLLRQMLLFDPMKRIDCESALQHPFFESCREPALEVSTRNTLNIDVEMRMEKYESLFASVKAELDHYPDV